MSKVYQYIVTTNPDEWDGPVYDSFRDANEVAQRTHACVVELEYEFSDSDLVVDYRPTSTVDED